MKRTGDWPRRKPLTSSTPIPRTALARRGALVRSSSLSRQAAGQVTPRKPLVSKPKPVTPEERRARKAVRARSGGTCEVCGRAPATNFQHRQGRAQLGAWTAENGLAVCGNGNVSGCHGAIHQNPATAYERGWSVRSTHNPADVAVWLTGRGWSYLLPDGGITPAERNAA